MIQETLLATLPAVSMSDAVNLILIITVALILFVSEKLPIEGVAMLVLIALLITGLVPESEILSGFANPATITVAAMFILSAGLARTGVVRWLAYRIGSLVGRNPNPKTATHRLAGVTGIATGILSAFINNTATVSVLLPVTLRLCREQNISPTKVLMTLSFAAQFGGVCTLIGTTTNLLVNAFAIGAGLEGFSMFEFATLGSILFVAGMAYMLTIGQWLLPERINAEDVTTTFSLKDYLTEMRVLEGSLLIGQMGGENALTEIADDIRILEIIRDGQPIWAPKNTAIKADDILVIRGSADRVLDAAHRLGLQDWAEGKLTDAHLKSDDVGLLEVLIPKGAKLIGKNLSQLDFYWRYHAAVLGVRRQNATLQSRISQIQFQEGDMLLLQGHSDDLTAISKDRDFIVLNDLSSLRLKKQKALTSLIIMGAFLFLAASGILSVLAAALSCAALMLLTKCLTLEEAYESLSLPVILLLAGLIPLGLAMQHTGAADWLAHATIALIGNLGPTVTLGVIYGLTMILTAIMSNTATAALLAPLSLGIAHTLGVSPIPFLVAVTFAASTCFTTPVGYQTNMMVYAPGGYKYLDFIKVGLPLNLMLMGLSIYLIPFFWPF